MRFRIWLSACWLASTGFLPAEEIRIAVVDMKAIFNAHPETNAAEQRMLKAREAARDVFRKKTDSLKSILQQHQDALLAGEKLAGAEAENKRAEAAALLSQARALEREVSEFKTTQEADLERGFLEEKKRIMDAVVAAVRAFNAGARFHLIVDRSAASATGIPAVIDVQGLPDVTQEVLLQLK